MARHREKEECDRFKLTQFEAIALYFLEGLIHVLDRFDPRR